MAIFNSKLLVITRGYEIEGPITWFQDIFHHTPSYPIDPNCYLEDLALAEIGYPPNPTVNRYP